MSRCLNSRFGERNEDKQSDNHKGTKKIHKLKFLVALCLGGELEAGVA
jgi:hypothetical protein